MGGKFGKISEIANAMRNLFLFEFNIKINGFYNLIYYIF